MFSHQLCSYIKKLAARKVEHAGGRWNLDCSVRNLGRKSRKLQWSDDTTGSKTLEQDKSVLGTFV